MIEAGTKIYSCQDNYKTGLEIRESVVKKVTKRTIMFDGYTGPESTSRMYKDDSRLCLSPESAVNRIIAKEEKRKEIYEGRNADTIKGLEKLSNLLNSLEQSKQ